MPLNPNIILQGRGVNALRSIDEGNRAAAFQGEQDFQRAGREFNAENGPGLLSGDQNALRGLSRFDPAQATQLQGHHEARARARQATARAATSRAEALRLKEAADRNRAMLSQAAISLKQGDVQAWNQVAAEYGMNGLEPTAENFGFLTALADGSEEGLLSALQGPEPVEMVTVNGQRVPANQSGDFRTPETPESDKPLTNVGKLKSDFDAGRIDQATYEAALGKALASNGTSLTVGADGTVSFNQGSQGGDIPKTTEGEKSAAGYLSRMQAAEKILTTLTEGGTETRNFTSLIVSGTNFEGIALGPQQEQLLQAMRDWVRAKLRKESGAVIGTDEMAEEIRTYFPLPGEDPTTIEQKRRSRLEAERQFEIMSGRAVDQVGTPSAEDIKNLTDEDLQRMTNELLRGNG